MPIFYQTTQTKEPEKKYSSWGVVFFLQKNENVESTKNDGYDNFEWEKSGIHTNSNVIKICVYSSLDMATISLGFFFALLFRQLHGRAMEFACHKNSFHFQEK